jgi:hypothetical protein
MWELSRHAGGREDLLTLEMADRIVESLRGGNSFRVTAGLCHIGEETLFRWLRRGKAEKEGRFREFWERVKHARVQLETLCTRTVRTAVVGGWFQSPVYDRDGRPVPEIDPETGEPLVDAQGRIKFQMQSEFQKPDAHLAFRLMQRLNKSEWGELDDNGSPDPEIEMAKAPTEETAAIADHKRISTPLVTQAMEILIKQGAKIPGFQITKIPEVVESAPADDQTKLIVSTKLMSNNREGV